MRTRKQDCWQASVRISIPIDATRPETISAAQHKVRELAALIPGSSAEITHAGFGRMTVTPAQVLARMAPQTLSAGEIVSGQSDQPEIPTFLRRNGAEPEDRSLDPSIDAR